MRAAHDHHVPHTDYLHWDRDDRLKEQALADYDADNCPECGVHPSAWSAKFGGDVRKPKVVPTWVYCRICELVAQAQEAGPPGPRGYHLSWAYPTYE